MFELLLCGKGLSAALPCECSHPPTCVPWPDAPGCVWLAWGSDVLLIVVPFLAEKSQTLLLPVLGLYGC